MTRPGEKVTIHVAAFGRDNRGYPGYYSPVVEMPIDNRVLVEGGCAWVAFVTLKVSE